MLKTMKELLAREESDGYKSDWKADAVEVLNEFYEEQNCYDDRIYDLESDEWEDLVKWNLEQRGWLGVKILLDGIDNSAEYAYLDGYGNGKTADYELKQKLEWAIEELERA